MSTSPQRESCNTSSNAVEGDDANNKEGASSSDHNEPESYLSLDSVEESETNSTDYTTRQAALQEANRLLLSATRLMLQLAVHATQGQLPQATVDLHCELLDVLEALGEEVGRCV